MADDADVLKEKLLTIASNLIGSRSYRDGINDLEKIGDQQSRDEFACFLTSDNWSIRKEAAMALMNLGDERGWDELVKAFGIDQREEDGTGYSRAEIAECLGKSKNPLTIDVLLKVLIQLNHSDLHDELDIMGSDYHLASTIVGVLGEIGDMRAIEPVKYWRDNKLNGLLLQLVQTDPDTCYEGTKGVVHALKVFDLWSEELILKLDPQKNLNNHVTT